MIFRTRHFLETKSFVPRQLLRLIKTVASDAQNRRFCCDLTVHVPFHQLLACVRKYVNQYIELRGTYIAVKHSCAQIKRADVQIA